MLTQEEVRQVARLARLELTPEEEQLFTGQIATIVTYMGKLQELSTGDVFPTSHVLPLQNVFPREYHLAFGGDVLLRNWRCLLIHLIAEIAEDGKCYRQHGHQQIPKFFVLSHGLLPNMDLHSYIMNVKNCII